VKPLDLVFEKLEQSPFRRRFSLGEREKAYLEKLGWAAILGHARAFVETRLAPESPARDGKQTPYRGHPVFIAQHATACCCRGCLEKWHGIPRGHQLAADETEHVLAALERWLRQEVGN
jgi:Domain of unknown function (DUF4186)